jgi:hypothetical protein
MVWKDLLVDAHPGALLVGLQVAHQPLEIPDHVLANLRDKSETFLSYENQNLAPVLFGDLAAGISEPFQAIHQPRGGRSCVPHPLRNFGHRKRVVLLGKKTKQKVLGKRDVSARKFLREMKDKAPLHDGENVRQFFCVGAHLGFITGLHVES